MKYFGVFCAFLHYFQHDVRASGLGYLDCVVFLIVEVDAIFIVCFAHLAGQGSPFDSDAVLGP